MDAGNFTCKVCLIGYQGVGKTTYMKRLLTGDFESQHIPTIGVEVHPLSFNVKSKSRAGKITFNVWDCAGKEELGGLRDGYYMQSNGAILMFDSRDRQSFLELEGIYQNFRTVCPNAPVVVCITKADMLGQGRKVPLSSLDQYEWAKGAIDISAKSCFNHEVPFLRLARELLSDEALEFTPDDDPEPSENEPTGNGLTPEMEKRYAVVDGLEQIFGDEFAEKLWKLAEKDSFPDLMLKVKKVFDDFMEENS